MAQDLVLAVLEPVTQLWASLGPIGKTVLVAGLGAAAAMYFAYKKSQDDEETIETESFLEKLTSIYTEPAESEGTKISDPIYRQHKGSSNRKIGKAMKVTESDGKAIVYDEDEEDMETKEVDGYSYIILESDKNLKLFFKVIFYKLGLKDMVATSWEIPERRIQTGDDKIFITPGPNFVKRNGVKREFSPVGFGKVADDSGMLQFEGAMDTLSQISEQLATLNNRISGQLRMMNQKSENMRKYKENERLQDKREAMED